MPEKVLWTIGHSTRTLKDFLTLLRKNGIQLLADVRRFPGSRKFPHFNRQELADTLQAEGSAYLHFPGLGGKRTGHEDSKNTSWRNASFRAYADYMETPEFRQSAQDLMHLALEKKTCILCSEAVWWRCHRGLIADYFKSKDWTVYHILSETKTEEHPYTPPARIVDGQLSYHPAPS